MSCALPVRSPPNKSRAPNPEAHLVRSKAIVQLDDTDQISALALPKPSLLEHRIRTPLRHTVTDDVHRALPVKRVRAVRRQRLGDDLDRLVLEPVLVHEVLRGDDTARGAVLSNSAVSIATATTTVYPGWTYRCRATHILRQLVRDLLRAEHLLLRPPVAKLGVRIVHGMLMILRRCAPPTTRSAPSPSSPQSPPTHQSSPNA